MNHLVQTCCVASLLLRYPEVQSLHVAAQHTGDVTGSLVAEVYSPLHFCRHHASPLGPGLACSQHAVATSGYQDWHPSQVVGKIAQSCNPAAVGVPGVPPSMA